MNAAPLTFTAELVLWSAVTGALALAVTMVMLDAALSRTKAACQLLAYQFTSALVVLIVGSPIETLCDSSWPDCHNAIANLRVLVGPLCAAIGCYGAGQWLYANRRDRTIRVLLLVMTVMSLIGGPLCLLLAPAARLPASAALAVASMAFAVWLAVRAAQRGDPLAWWLATGCALALLAQLGIYHLALSSVRPALGQQSAVAFVAIASIVVTGLTIWRRNRQIRYLYQGRVTDRDPANGLLNSLPMLQKIIASQLTRRKNGGDGALMAVMLFEPETLLPQIGHTGLNELYTELALRMRRHTGIINPAGRYYDRCFLVLFETMHSPRWLATLSLKTAASLRVPVELTSLSGEKIMMRADIGVGIIHVAEGAKNVDDLVHEAQVVATTARSLASRAALLDPLTGLPVAAESADLGSRWKPIRDASRGGPKSRSGKKSRPGRTRPA